MSTLPVLPWDGSVASLASQRLVIPIGHNSVLYVTFQRFDPFPLILNTPQKTIYGLVLDINILWRLFHIMETGLSIIRPLTVPRGSMYVIFTYIDP